MASEKDVDTSRTVVKTYVPTYQKKKWKKYADQLDMSQSEFVRSMVQAGRRDFNLQPIDGGDGGREIDVGVKERVITLLSNSEYLSWDEILDGLTENIEDDLEKALQSLQQENQIQYSGRQGGYSIVERDSNE